MKRRKKFGVTLTPFSWWLCRARYSFLIPEPCIFLSLRTPWPPPASSPTCRSPHVVRSPPAAGLRPPSRVSSSGRRCARRPLSAAAGARPQDAIACVLRLPSRASSGRRRVCPPPAAVARVLRLRPRVLEFDAVCMCGMGR